MTHCLTHHITHCLTHRITHPITKLDCMTYQDLSICTEEAKQSSYTISHTVAVSAFKSYGGVLWVESLEDTTVLGINMVSWMGLR